MKDAWKQHHDLVQKYTKDWEVRKDLTVSAMGCDRAVRLSLADPLNPGEMFRHWHTTTRNVGTMRELAQAILDACDFVEQSNPTWAEGL